LRLRTACYALVVGLVASGCGSGVLRSTISLRSTDQTVAGSPSSAAVMYLSPTGEAWEVGRAGALYFATPGGSAKRIGTVPLTSYESPATSLVVDPSDHAYVYANADALLTSRDGGRTWHATPRNAGGIWPDVVATSGPVVYALRAPDGPSCGSCGVWPHPWRLFASRDHGETWSQVATFGADELWGLLPAAHQSPGSVWVATSAGLFLHRPGRPDVERDAGIHRSYGNQPSIPILAASSDGDMLYAAVSDGENADGVSLYVSDNQGVDWHLRRSPFHQTGGVLLVDPADPNIAFAVVNETLTHGTLESAISGWGSSIYVSYDNAHSWREIWHGCLRIGIYGFSPAVLVGRTRTIVTQLCSGQLTSIHTRA
jgi:hypothetical protein